MNFNNQYIQKHDVPLAVTFTRTPHSNIAYKTKTLFTEPPNELIKNSYQCPLPIFTVKPLKYAVDPVQEFTEKRENYITEKKLVESRLKRHMSLSRVSKTNPTSNGNIKLYIQNMLSNPYPYIDENEMMEMNFNKGTLEAITVDDKNYLAYIWNNSTIKFHQYNRNSELKCALSTFNKPVQAPNELMIDKDANVAAIRYGNYVKIAKFSDEEVIKNNSIVETIDEYKSKEDLIASSLNDKYLVTIDSKYHLTRYNINIHLEHVSLDLNDYIPGYLLPISINDLVSNERGDSFATITTRNTFGRIDYRCKKKIACNIDFSKKDFLMQCEKIYNHTESQIYKNLTYILTSHMLYGFDYRQLKAPAIYWTHQIVNPPTLLQTSLLANEEIICASSNKPGDWKVFNNNGDSINLFPVKPTCIKSTHSDLREQGLFLLSDTIEERVNATITGIAMHCDTKSSQINLFAQNYFGDIIETVLNYQTVKKERNDFRVPIERFQQWENFLQRYKDPNHQPLLEERLTQEEFVIDNIVRLKGLSKVMKGEIPPKKDDDSDVEEVVDNNMHTKPRPRWKISIEEAKQYNDLLAKEIMNVWEDIDHEEDFTPAGSSDDVNPENKVEKWLEAAPDYNNMTFEEFPVGDIQIEEIEFLPSIESTQKSGTKKKKPRLAGF